MQEFQIISEDFSQWVFLQAQVVYLLLYRDDFIKYLNNAWVFVIPSLGYFQHKKHNKK